MCGGGEFLEREWMKCVFQLCFGATHNRKPEPVLVLQVSKTNLTTTFMPKLLCISTWNLGDKFSSN